MDKKALEIISEDELVKYLVEHSGDVKPYDDETKAHIQKLISQLGLSKNILRVHEDVRKK